MPDVTKEVTSTKDLYHGHVVVSVTAISLCGSFPTKRGVMLRTPGPEDPVPNTVPVWVGRSTVTADSAATGGFPLKPGASLFMPVDDPSGIFVISTTGGQDIAWIGV